MVQIKDYGDASMNSAVSPPPLPEFKTLFKQAVDLKNEGRSADAMQVLERLLIMSSNSASVLALRGDTLWDLGRLVEAISSFQRAVALAPASEMASLGLFHTLLESGDKQRALAEMDRFLSLTDSQEYESLAQSLGHNRARSDT